MLKLLLISLLFGLAVAAPTTETSNDSNKPKVNRKIVIEQKYFRLVPHFLTTEHDIVQILIPTNALKPNYRHNEAQVPRSPLFIVEADEVNGVREYKGVSTIYSGIEGVKKLLETGTSVAATDDNASAFIGATDGLYKYNTVDKTAEKFGKIDDNLIGVAKVNGSDLIYILTKDNVLYKVTENGTKKVKVNEVVGAKQIVLDNSNNLYYYGEDKIPYVFNENGVKKIEGIPSNVSEITLLRPPFFVKSGVPTVVDNKAYMIDANGAKMDTVYEFDVKPTAYSMEAFQMQAYAYNKNIYFLDIMTITAYIAMHAQQTQS